MGKKYSGNNGTSIKLLTEKLKKEMLPKLKNSPKIGTTRKKNISNRFQSGKLTASDWKNINFGIEILEKIVKNGLSKQDIQLLAGQDDVSKVKKEINGYQEIIKACLENLSKSSFHQYQFRQRISSLADYSQIAQAARDGIILKQETRKEFINGEEKEIKYDTSMSPSEVISILEKYDMQNERLSFNKLHNYLGIGLGISGAIGALLKNGKRKDNSESGTIALVSISTAVVGSLKLMEGLIINPNSKKDSYKFWDEERRLKSDLYGNEQVSHKAEESSINGIIEIINQDNKLGRKIDNTRFAYNIVLELAIAIMSGAYINKKVKIKENGKIDGRSLATAIIDLQATKNVTGQFLTSVQRIVKDRKEYDELQEMSKKIQEILNQMDEKVYPLEGAKHSFNSISIHNFTGNFYPKKNYDTGEINYATTINIPEFSMKRGDVVLLSGESGTGKSTFLRFLKRGDINNRQAIKLDDREMVDHLGDEYISFRPSINLGDETNVLYQITGKKNISDLSKDMRIKLEKILRELKFDNPNLLEQLASKKFMEFSTGQQRRLALSKMFYRIDDGTSVIIVDEPVGNVEDSLIRDQLEMIKKYATRKNVMLILTTHRLNLAEDLATKRYHISKEGILEQLPIKENINQLDVLEQIR